MNTWLVKIGKWNDQKWLGQDGYMDRLGRIQGWARNMTWPGKFRTRTGQYGYLIKKDMRREDYFSFMYLT